MTLSKQAYKRAFFKAAVITALLCPFLWSPLNRFLLNGVLFTPMPYPTGYYNVEKIGGIAPEDNYFTADNKKRLHGWFFANPGATYTVLLSHGLTGNLTLNKDLIALLLKSGVSVFAYDYQGYGRSEGSSSVEMVCADARSAYHYLVNDKKIDSSRVILFGESLGTGVTTNLSTNVPCAGIILQCPFVSLRKRAIEIFPVEAIYPQSFYPENALDNTAILSRAHAPLLVIGGEQDSQLPVWHADEVAATALEPKSYTRIKNAGHSGDLRLYQAPEYLASLKSFVASLKDPNKSLAKPHAS